MNRFLSFQEKRQAEGADKIITGVDGDLKLGFFLLETGGGSCWVRGVLAQILRRFLSVPLFPLQGWPR